MSKYIVRYYYSQRWVGRLNRAGVTFGRHVFFKETCRSLISERLLRHELAHVRQYARFRLLGQWWVAVPVFLVVYFCQWVAAGFRWRRIHYEVEVRAAETLRQVK